MKVFIFEPSNEYICKLAVPSLDQVTAEFQKYAANNPALAIGTYAEVSGRRWTLLSREPFQLHEGLSSEPPSAFESPAAAGAAPRKMSRLGRLALWSGGITVGAPILWVLLCTMLSGNAALGAAWFGVLPVLVGVPIGIVVTLALTIAAVVSASNRKDEAKAGEPVARDGD